MKKHNFKVGDKVIKNEETWESSDFDFWGVSATEVRKSIFEDSGKFETLVPKVVINYKEIIKSFILIHNK